MAYASQAGRAKVNPSNPQAQAVCDRCGIWYNHVALRWQFDWRGPTLQNIRLLVCNSCYDTPQTQLRVIVIPADPVPVTQPRVEPFLQDEYDPRIVSETTATDPITGIPIPSTTIRVTEDGSTRTTQPIGEPVGLVQPAVQPLYQTTHYGVELDVISVTSVGTDVITVNCRAAHGMANGDQISVEGLSLNAADGFYSVGVATAMTFTYQTGTLIPAGALLTSTSRIITALVGLPLGYDEIPLTGIPE